MGFSSEMLIAEENRNEAQEAIDLIEKVQIAIIGDDYDAAMLLQEAIEKIQRFAGKYKPEIQRWK